MTSKVIFRSDDLPAGLGNRARISLWRDMYVERFGACDAYCDPERPFSARSEFAMFGEIGFAQFDGTIDRFVRTRQQVASDPGGELFFIGINCGRSAALISHGGRDAVFAPGQVIFMNGSEPTATRGPSDDAWVWASLGIPHKRLLSLVADAEDQVMTPIDPQAPAMRHLRRYMWTLQGPDGLGDDPVLAAHIGATLLDLVALALGARRDAAEVARMRGLRAARLQQILGRIKAEFANPAFSSQDVADTLGVSQRYVNDILFETGQSFAERVLELRLQKAYRLLADGRAGPLKVSDVALACGFNEVSYFNRRFRARFGCSPTQCRSGSNA
jgi:AraC-like DNA-binding protein